MSRVLIFFFSLFFSGGGRCQSHGNRETNCIRLMYSQKRSVSLNESRKQAAFMLEMKLLN